MLTIEDNNIVIKSAINKTKVQHFVKLQFYLILFEKLKLIWIFQCKKNQKLNEKQYKVTVFF